MHGYSRGGEVWLIECNEDQLHHPPSCRRLLSPNHQQNAAITISMQCSALQSLQSITILMHFNTLYSQVNAILCTTISMHHAPLRCITISMHFNALPSQCTMQHYDKVQSQCNSVHYNIIQLIRLYCNWQGITFHNVCSTSLCYISLFLGCWNIA